MSRKLWLRLFHCFEGVYREVALQHPLLGAPQRYLCSQRARAHLVGEHPHHPRSPLHLFKEPLEHVRRAYAGMVASGVAYVGQGLLYARLENADDLRVTLAVKSHEREGRSAEVLRRTRSDTRASAPIELLLKEAGALSLSSPAPPRLSRRLLAAVKAAFL